MCVCVCVSVCFFSYVDDPWLSPSVRFSTLFLLTPPSLLACVFQGTANPSNDGRPPQAKGKGSRSSAAIAKVGRRVTWPRNTRIDGSTANQLRFLRSGAIQKRGGTKRKRNFVVVKHAPGKRLEWGEGRGFLMPTNAVNCSS